MVHTALDYIRSRTGGAMLIGGFFTLISMATAGGFMSNYAWREAQWVELHAATRAAVSAVGTRLGGAMDGEIQARVAEYAGGLMPGMTVEADDVDISYDAATGVTTVSVSGNYVFDDIWRAFGGDDSETVNSVVRVKLETDRYEVAMALDVSFSMSKLFADRTTRIEGLKTAVHVVANTVESASATNPGSIMVAVVPYSTNVNVADTCNRDPNTDYCRSARTAAKERYVRMLAGGRPTMDETLADARSDAANDTGGHWVDTFHQYGASVELGSLQRQYLPADLLDNVDWNLRRQGVDIDIAAQVPSLGAWQVDDKDFWNGCLMARWGAYWNPDARPLGWSPDDADNWPATDSVRGWSSASSPLPDDTPLHLSDAPPTADDPNTLFTAYSWPDARISGFTDHRLQGSMMEMLHPGWATDFGGLLAEEREADIAWSRPGNGGDVLCPSVPIMPLTDDFNMLRDVADRLQTTGQLRFGNSATSATYLSLGMSWGLRAISPLWQGTWDVRDVQQTPRPAVPCALGEDETYCDSKLRKSILLVSDGSSSLGNMYASRLMNHRGDDRNPSTVPRCSSYYDTYFAAAEAQAETAFNAYFRAPYVAADLVDANDRLNADGRERLVDALLVLSDPGPNSPERRTAMLDALASLDAPGVAPTPWQVFRGLDADIIDALMAPAAMLGFDGRPTLIGQHCEPPWSMFGPYGRAADLVYVGDGDPVADVAPFEIASLPPAVVGTPTSRSATVLDGLKKALEPRMDGWFLDACAIAGARRVRVNAIFIGPTELSTEPQIALLEQCVDLAGGSPATEEVFVTPTAEAIEDAFRSVFTIRRNLRFLN